MGAEADAAFPIVIVGRALCFEIEKNIPVDSWFEARRIAHNIPVSAPFDGTRKVRLLTDSNGGYRAVITVINDVKVKSSLTSPPLGLIPISWIADRLAGGTRAQIEFAGEVVGFAASKPMGITMQLNSPEQVRDFWWAVGADPTNVNVVSHEAVQQDLLPALMGMALPQWVDVFRGNGTASLFDISSLDWLKFAKTVVLFSISYLAIISILLGGYGGLTSSRASHESVEFLEVLNTRGQLNRLAQEDQQWRVLMGEQFPVWAVWPVIEGVSENGVFISAIELAGGSVEVSFFAEDATAVLNKIIESPYTSDVEFGTSIRKSRDTNLEQFSIRWDSQDSDSSVQAATP